MPLPIRKTKLKSEFNMTDTELYIYYTPTLYEVKQNAIKTEIPHDGKRRKRKEKERRRLKVI
jgi:hypothetical protein